MSDLREYQLVLADGEVFEADLVVDAMGRRSPTPRWLEEIGANPPAEHAGRTGDECGDQESAGASPVSVGTGLPLSG